MKRLILPTAFAFVLAGGLAFGQAQAPDNGQGQPPVHHRPMHPRNPEKEAEFLSKRLNLTPEQTSKLEPIFADRNQKMEAIHSNTSLTRQDAWTQMREVEKSTHEQLATVLTPEQMKEMHPRRGDHHGHEGQQNPPAPSV